MLGYVGVGLVPRLVTTEASLIASHPSPSLVPIPSATRRARCVVTWSMSLDFNSRSARRSLVLEQSFEARRPMRHTRWVLWSALLYGRTDLMQLCTRMRRRLNSAAFVARKWNLRQSGLPCKTLLSPTLQSVARFVPFRISSSIEALG